MQAIQALYQQHATVVYRFSLGLCGDKHLTNDLVAETFVRAMMSSSPIGMEDRARLSVHYSPEANARAQADIWRRRWLSLNVRCNVIRR